MTFIEILLLLIIIAILASQNRGGLLVFRKKRIILDSCALIDGRILEIVQTGFIVDELILPQFVLSELQLLADGQDAHKRERARFGLDMAAELQKDPAINIKINHENFSASITTDDKLIILAKKLKARLYTTDYNLSKVAEVEGLTVLNVNELAQNLRPVSLPGEVVSVKILQKGSNQSQGVGYMADGTMVVVDGAAQAVGKKVDATVIRMHQTVAGKMIFAQLAKPRKAQTPEPKHARKEHVPLVKSIRNRMRSRKIQI